MSGRLAASIRRSRKGAARRSSQPARAAASTAASGSSGQRGVSSRIRNNITVARSAANRAMPTGSRERLSGAAGFLAVAGRGGPARSPDVPRPVAGQPQGGQSRIRRAPTAGSPRTPPASRAWPPAPRRAPGPRRRSTARRATAARARGAAWGRRAGASGPAAAPSPPGTRRRCRRRAAPATRSATRGRAPPSPPPRPRPPPAARPGRPGAGPSRSASLPHRRLRHRARQVQRRHQPRGVRRPHVEAAADRHQRRRDHRRVDRVEHRAEHQRRDELRPEAAVGLPGCAGPRRPSSGGERSRAARIGPPSFTTRTSRRSSGRTSVRASCLRGAQPRVDRLGQPAAPGPAARAAQPLAGVGEREDDLAPVGRVRGAGDQAALLQGGQRHPHGLRPDQLRPGERGRGGRAVLPSRAITDTCEGVSASCAVVARSRRESWETSVVSSSAVRARAPARSVVAMASTVGVRQESLQVCLSSDGPVGGPRLSVRKTPRSSAVTRRVCNAGRSPIRNSGGCGGGGIHVLLPVVGRDAR